MVEHRGAQHGRPVGQAGGAIRLPPVQRARPEHAPRLAPVVAPKAQRLAVKRHLLLLACVVALGAAGQVAAARLGRGAGARVALPNPVPSWGPSYVDNGAAPASVVLRFRLYLTGRAPRAEIRFATQVSSPGSRRFRHYLSPGEFKRLFGPTTRQIEAVSRWAVSNGLTVMGANEHYLSLRGSAPAV